MRGLCISIAAEGGMYKEVSSMIKEFFDSRKISYSLEQNLPRDKNLSQIEKLLLEETNPHAREKLEGYIKDKYTERVTDTLKTGESVISNLYPDKADIKININPELGEGYVFKKLQMFGCKSDPIESISNKVDLKWSPTSKYEERKQLYLYLTETYNKYQESN